MIEHISWHAKTDKIKILIIFGIDDAPSQSEFILPILQSTLKTIESLPILISIILIVILQILLLKKHAKAGNRMQNIIQSCNFDNGNPKNRCYWEGVARFVLRTRNPINPS